MLKRFFDALVPNIRLHKTLLVVGIVFSIVRTIDIPRQVCPICPAASTLSPSKARGHNSGTPSPTHTTVLAFTFRAEIV